MTTRKRYTKEFKLDAIRLVTELPEAETVEAVEALLPGNLQGSDPNCLSNPVVR